MSSSPTRWAIAGAGRISGNFASALNLAPRSEHLLVSVGARCLERAQEFAQHHNIPQAYGSYEEMALAANDNQIDMVYIGTVNPTHKTLCELFINVGVNVLCEKPFTVNSKQAKCVIDLARKKGVFLMEGFWSRFFPAYEELRRELRAGTIGEPRCVLSNFGRNLQHMPDHNVFNKDQAAAGSLMALGCYNVQLAQMVYNYEKPQEIHATGFINEKAGVDDFVSATLMYSNNRIAVLNSSLAIALDPLATISGSLTCGADEHKAIIKMPHLLCPTELVTPSGTKQFPLKNVSPVPLPSRNAEGMIYEADAARECLLKGLKEHPLCTWEQTLQHMEILDEIRSQIGLHFKWDTQ